MSRMWAVCDAGFAVLGVDHVGAVAAPFDPIIDIQVQHEVFTFAVAVGNAFADAAGPLAVPLNAVLNVAPVTAFVAMAPLAA